MSILTSGVRGALAAALACSVLPGTLQAQSATASFDPTQVDYQLDPGQTQLIKAQVCLPGVPIKADIYLLADITTSMFPVLDQIKANAAVIVNSLLSTSGADIEVGIGSYRDFPFDPKPFDHQVSPTKLVSNLVGAINTWNASGGGDVSEGQFYALYQIATDPNIGFRPDAKRIILWFGDSPAHDPICPIFNGFGNPTFPIDEALVTSALQAAGISGGTAVIAVSTPDSQFFPLGLNDNPKADAKDYSAFCGVGGTPGQADRLAEATGGISTSLDDPTQVTAAILDSVNALLVKANVACNVSGSIVPFVKSITPPFYANVVLPPNASDQVCVDFDVLLEGPPCMEAGQILNGSIKLIVNKTPLASQPLKLHQPSCSPLHGQLWIGPRRLDPPLKFPNGGPTDVLLVLPTYTAHVDLASIAALPIPDNSALAGLSVYCQCGLFDGFDFPKDKLKTSNGLKVTFDDPGDGLAFGDPSGLLITLKHPANVNGSLALSCMLSP